MIIGDGGGDTKHILRAACIVVNYIFLCLWSSATLRMVLTGELGELLFQEGLSGFIICLLGLQVA